MTADESFKAGRLQEAVDAQLQAVKKDPLDHGKRLFLFELLAFQGELDRAGKQIDAIEFEDPERNAAKAAYNRLLQAERTRRQLFAEGTPPKYLDEPPAHVPLRLKAAEALRQNNLSEASTLLAQAAASMPEVHGELNGKPFELLVDCDDLFGTVLEVISSTGAYFWVPLEQVDKLVVQGPRYPRDLLWAPAHLTVKKGDEGEVYLPVLYPDSYAHPKEEVKLGRVTEWQADEGAPVRGHGMRVFLVDEAGVNLLDWRTLNISS